MNLDEAHTLAVSLMHEYGLGLWRFRFDRAVRRAGSCNHTKRTLTLSRVITELNDAATVEQTIRHEIAHALTSPKAAAHGPEWKRKAVEVGARPVRCGDFKVPDGKWQARCGCGKVYHRHQRPRHLYYICPVCRSDMRFQQVREVVR